ncbi:phage integrase N-terminal domain-containing protein [Pleionea litopenaei]|uniref:Phage integrase N-terminal domain-containing protein n=1 Tax=Pleionea litopenaei TaxID=3070815 RepID=A0AA51X8S6_9GAMM|nr:phage integrase N-terminal domain-containing protein [Pleionea sp. HL-JVS1]WMS89291.1 phage integrase N-terminal domain-containing protein [Pleionea sp. HL-JVS1]WMS89312.1 phage integrase N-terminal domain-containing protein [Pleionea sp. HL-JVS1]
MSKNISYDLHLLQRRNRDGSIATQSNRNRILQQMGKQLHELGFRNMQAKSLKEKHVDALVKKWQADGLSAGTMKNRMSTLRWWAEKIGKRNIVARDNSHYGIDDRQYVSQESKAQKLENETLGKIKDPYLKMSLELQREFGLRREESMKFQPSYADQGDFIRLKASWTKGGRERVVPITSESQRTALDKAHKIAGRGSLIPPNKKYIQQLRLYEKHTSEVGLSKLHGLRHEYAQRRYCELTGWKAPVAGGPSSKQLTAEQKQLDRSVRLQISEELGHSREQITTVYLGR